MDKNDIGTFLYNIRSKRSLSQEQVAELSGFTRRQQVLEIEQSKVDYRITTLIKTLEALGYKLSIVPIHTTETISNKQEINFSKVKVAKKGDTYEKEHFAEQRKEKINHLNPL